jgi:hypothetical protein
VKHLSWLLACSALAAAGDALALGSLANVTIIDRDSGAALSTYYYRGDYWVAGNPGSRYAIEIRNCTPGRVLAVTSVDGVNVLSGATAAWDQSGYVFDGGERYQITGWRKSNEQVAAFTFTASPNSYAERTGRPANVGVIGVALFRERPSHYIPPRITHNPGAAPEAREEFDSSARAGVPPAAAQDASPPALLGGITQDRRGGDIVSSTQPAPKLGTGHGAREYSYVQDTEFQRLQSEPNEVIRIRYDSLQNLVAMGIVRRPHPLPTVPNAFPGSQREFVPDPPG